MASVLKSLREHRKPLLLAALTGGLLGTLVSFLVAAVMLEISDNRFFAVYFGLLFLVIGLAIVRRVTITSVWMEGGRLARFFLALFSLIVIFAGISCFILDHNALKLSPGQRIPFYIFLGIAVSFAVTFALVDVLNTLISSIRTSQQVFLVLGASVLSGAVFGLVFGILDVEDDPSARHGLISDERYSAPVGFVVGSVSAMIAYRMDHHQYVVAVPYVPRNFDEGI